MRSLLVCFSFPWLIYTISLFYHMIKSAHEADVDGGIVLTVGSSDNEFTDPWARPDNEDVVVGDDILSSFEE